jgi:hypothetical protein
MLAVNEESYSTLYRFDTGAPMKRNQLADLEQRKIEERKVRDGEALLPAREARALPGSGNNRVGE